MSGCCCRRGNGVDDYDVTKSNIYVINRTSSTLEFKPLQLDLNEMTSTEWKIEKDTVMAGEQIGIIWIDRSFLHTVTNNGKPREIAVSFVVGGQTVVLTHKLVAELGPADIHVQISAAGQRTGWSHCGGGEKEKYLCLIFKGTDERLYQISAAKHQLSSVSLLTAKEDYVLPWTLRLHLDPDHGSKHGDVAYTVTDRGSNCILPQIEHIVVLMFENRSLDSILGWIYPGDGKVVDPNRFIPTTSQQVYNGLNTGTYSNEHPEVNQGRPVAASCGTAEGAVGAPYKNDKKKIVSAIYRVPTIDPGEEFENVAEQIADDMKGFIANFVKQVKASKKPVETAASIMDCYHPKEVPVLSSLACSFAVSDAWFASVPSQTWPNRSFALTGSSAGKVNNDILQQKSKGSWNIPTIFDLLEKEQISWKVYKGTSFPALSQAMYAEKYLFKYEHNFRSVDEFKKACAQPLDADISLKLPTFTWLEPHFGIQALGNDQNDESYHPPRDIRKGEKFLSEMYEVVRSSPYRDKILFLILFDEHGGTYDHVPPPMGAAPPYPNPTAIDGSGFDFSRFGVRVPAIVISSYVTPGTVFRSTTSVPHDHTSLLSTVRDWRGLSEAFKTDLSSPRIAAAPTLSPVLVENKPLSWPAAQSPIPMSKEEEEDDKGDNDELNDLQKLIHAADCGKKRGCPMKDSERADHYKKIRTFKDVY